MGQFYFLQYACLLISFSCLTAPARPSNIDRSGDSEHYCLVPNPREKALSLSYLSITLAIGQL